MKAFRKNSGGDEFYVLLEGTIIDALGYLNRLAKRRDEFEEMSEKILPARHTFGFNAGIVSVAVDESFESVNKRVSECLQIAQEETSRRRVYWIESEMPKVSTPSQKQILQETESLFGKTPLREKKSPWEAVRSDAKI